MMPELFCMRTVLQAVTLLWVRVAQMSTRIDVAEVEVGGGRGGRRGIVIKIVSRLANFAFQYYAPMNYISPRHITFILEPKINL